MISRLPQAKSIGSCMTYIAPGGVLLLYCFVLVFSQQVLGNVTLRLEQEAIGRLAIISLLQLELIHESLFLAFYLMLGGLTALIVPGSLSNLSRSLSRLLGWSILALLCIVTLFAIDLGWPTLWQTSLAAVGCLAGYVFVCQLRNPAWKLKWLATELVALLLLACLVFTLSYFMAVESTPAVAEYPPIEIQEKRTLYDTLRAARRESPGHEEFVSIELGEKEVNQMLAIGLELYDFPRRIDISLEEGYFEARASLPLELANDSPTQYLNIAMRGRVVLPEKSMFELESLRVGQFEVPRFALPEIVSEVMGRLELREDVSVLLASIHNANIKAGRVQVICNQAFLKEKLIPTLKLQEDLPPDIERTVLVYLEELVEIGNSIHEESDRDRLVEVLRRTAQFAQERSRHSDPVLENRAALIALAVVLGHKKTELLSGQIVDWELYYEARGAIGEVSIKGRRDWVQHYLVSAALATQVTSRLSQLIGLAKEQIDSDGGSGFSLGDLLADRAGTRLGEMAVSDKAVQLQEALASIESISEIFPAAKDLPEGLQTEDFKERFGSVQDPRFQKLIEEIDQRIDSCKVFAGN